MDRLKDLDQMIWAVALQYRQHVSNRILKWTLEMWWKGSRNSCCLWASAFLLCSAPIRDRLWRTERGLWKVSYNKYVSLCCTDLLTMHVCNNISTLCSHANMVTFSSTKPTREWPKCTGQKPLGGVTVAVSIFYIQSVVLSQTAVGVFYIVFMLYFYS